MKQFVHHLELESQKQSIEWRHTIFPKKKKFEKVSTGGKIMTTGFLG
jgi:hypothetical protein